MVIFGSYALGQLFSGSILPTIAGAPIHEYAYMILFVVILSATGVIPKYPSRSKTFTEIYEQSLCSRYDGRTWI